MNEVTSNIRAALTILDAQASRIGNDLDAEAHNLQDLVENRDVETQEQITQLSQSLAQLHNSLTKIRHHLVESYTCARRHSSSDEEVPPLENPEKRKSDSGSTGHRDDQIEQSDSDREVDLHPAEASSLRHDEPTTLTGIVRSLLMANEPAQRKNSEKSD